MFSYNCYIHKNTQEIRDKLEHLGYIAHPSVVKMFSKDQDNISDHLYTGRGFYSTLPIGYEEENSTIIDCQDNEELFLAISAIKDDTDKDQWFIIDTRDCVIESMRVREYFVCDEDKIEDMMFYDSMFLNCHKATVDELIEHFKVE